MSATRLKPPFFLRHVTIRSAFAGPTVGNSINCSSVAVLMLILPLGGFFGGRVASAPSASALGLPESAGVVVVVGDAEAAVVQVPPIARTSATRAKNAGACVRTSL